jgi:tetratricopeptide (TPR) repeat protein
MVSDASACGGGGARLQGFVLPGWTPPVLSHEQTGYLHPACGQVRRSPQALEVDRQAQMPARAAALQRAQAARAKQTQEQEAIAGRSPLEAAKSQGDVLTTGIGAEAISPKRSLAREAEARFTSAGASLAEFVSGGAQRSSEHAAMRPLGPGAFFIATAPNPFAGSRQSVMECMFFSDDIDRKISGCSDLLADAQGEPRPGIDYVKADQRRDPKNLAAAHYHRAFGLRLKHDLKSALADLDAAVERAPGLASIVDQRGRVHGELGQTELAIADFTQAIRLAPKYVPTYQTRAATYYGRGELDKAIADASEAIRLDPKLAKSWLIRAISLEKAGRRDQALADYRHAAELDPTNALAHAGITRLGG